MFRKTNDFHFADIINYLDSGTSYEKWGDPRKHLTKLLFRFGFLCVSTGMHYITYHSKRFF